MRRPRSKTVIPEEPHHVILRGNNRRRLFSYVHDYLFFLRQLARGLDKHLCGVHALTLMANHVHLLVTPSTVERLSALMKFVAQTYAQYRNRRREGSGKLFEERFRAERVIGEGGIQSVTTYIEANALKAGLVTDPFDYPWSTYAIHAGQPARARIPPGLVQPSAWYQSLGETSAARARAYREIFTALRTEDPSKTTLERDCAALEERAAPYTRRLERPNRTRASESRLRYGIRALVDPRPRNREPR